MLNIAFTTTIGKVGQHYALWQPFLAFLFDTLMYQNPGLIYVFMGKKAQEWADSIPDNNFKIFTTHPAFAAHTDAERWDSGDLFNKVWSEIVVLYYITQNIYFFCLEGWHVKPLSKIEEVVDGIGSFLFLCAVFMFVRTIWRTIDLVITVIDLD